jgi:hypothetical protein
VTIAIIIGVVILGFWYWKSRPIKNSHKLPQRVTLSEFDTDEPEKAEKLIKGHKLLLERKLGHLGYHLFVTLDANGRDLSHIKKVIISWSVFKQRLYNFQYEVTDPEVEIMGDKLTINIGSFNNCPGSENFLERSSISATVTFDLLDYLPTLEDFEYEKDETTQCYFNCYVKWNELKMFKKGVHYIDS